MRFGGLFRGRQMFVIKDDEGGTFSHKTIEIAFGQITVYPFSSKNH